jgi:hypothetical protein
MLNQDACLDLPLVSYRGLQRSTRILQLMVNYYFPIHGFGLDDYFTCHPVLSFFSALIYQTDDRTEALQAAGAAGAAVQAGHDWHATIDSVLKALKLVDPLVQRELAAITTYVELETHLMHSTDFTLADLRRALELRSSDLRAMHRLALLTMQRSVDETLFQLCYPLEVMAEIRDDLYQYDDDRGAGKFNSYLLLQKLYGNAAPEQLLQVRQYYRQMFLQRMQAAPEPLQELLTPASEEAFALETLPCPQAAPP